MNYNYLKIDKRELGITIVTISVPQSLNALNSHVLEEINYFIENSLNSARVLIFTGEGEKSFVSGADIAEMSHLNEEGGYKFGAFGAMVFRKIEMLDIPVIAAVNGYAFGGGCELAMACDFRLASENARFGQPEVGLGITPGFSGTYRMPKLIGQAMAKELIFTGRAIKADEALRIGLVNAVYPLAELMNETLKIAQTIISKAPIAIKYAKQSINQGYDLSSEEAIELESRLFGKCFNTNDQKEGMSAFLEKRPANFKNE